MEFETLRPCSSTLASLVHHNTGPFSFLKSVEPYVSMYNYYLIQNSQAVKKVCGPQKGYGEKRCEIQGGGQEMAVMVG